MTGCETTSHQNYGDARVYRTDVHLSLFPAVTPRFKMELPKVSLAKESSYVFQITTSPVQKTDKISASISALTNDCAPATLYMKLPPADHSQIDWKNLGRHLPWRNAMLNLEIKTPDDKVIYQNSFSLGKLKWNYEEDKYWGWNVSAFLPDVETALRGLPDYKIIMTVQKTSARKRDFIQLKGQWSWVDDFWTQPINKSNQEFNLQK